MIAKRAKSRLLLRSGGMLAALVVFALTAGCVQRRLTIRSNPPGAYVYVDNYPIGTTPVSTDFVYYGKRQIRLVRDGYETLTVDQKIRAPWYQWFGIDFISENLVPYNIRDEQTLNFTMAPQQVPSSPQLTARAEELRSSSQAQRYVPPPVPLAPPPGAVPPPPPGTIVQPPPPGLLPPPTTQPLYIMPNPGTAPAGQPAPPVALPPPGPFPPPAGAIVPPPDPRSTTPLFPLR